MDQDEGVIDLEGRLEGVLEKMAGIRAEIFTRILPELKGMEVEIGKLYVDARGYYIKLERGLTSAEKALLRSRIEGLREDGMIVWRFVKRFRKQAEGN